MAKRKAGTGRAVKKSRRKAVPATRKRAAAPAARRPAAKAARRPKPAAFRRRQTTKKKKAPAKRIARKAARPRPAPKKLAVKRAKRPKVTTTGLSKARPHPPTHQAPTRLSRQRRTLDDATLPSPPSSLDLNREASAARTGRAEMHEHRADHATMTPSIAAGDLDVSVEDAYFTGDESPGGDNSTPDQDVVDDIGKALGVEYADNEELQSGDKVAERDRHRWELDPASAEDFRNRDKE